ncbi:hypothetical protein QUB05_32530 [Microcoleus sp. F10-C6]|uniref:hypothetical protein n=1 Tax=unclassified Microcoleus TaxID=2642155 RepID=UPI002FD280D8
MSLQISRAIGFDRIWDAAGRSTLVAIAIGIPKSGAKFKVPALWADGWCQLCFLGFEEMTEERKFC